MTGIHDVSGAEPATWPCALILVGLSAPGKPVLSGAFPATVGAEEPPSVPSGTSHCSEAPCNLCASVELAVSDPATFGRVAEEPEAISVFV